MKVYPPRERFLTLASREMHNTSEPCDLEGQRCARRLTFPFATERSQRQRDAETMHDGLRDATSDTVGTGSLGRILSAIVSTMGVALVGYGTFALLFGW